MKRKADVVRKSRGRRRGEGERPSTLGLAGVAVIFGTAAAATVLGALQVQARFAERDYEMEARRLQELARERRDDTKELQSRLGGLKRGEMLREAALGPLGMIEPPAESIGDLRVDPALITAFEDAQFKAQKEIAAERARLEAFRKEEL